jgi:hypothetical protein
MTTRLMRLRRRTLLGAFRTLPFHRNFLFHGGAVPTLRPGPTANPRLDATTTIGTSGRSWYVDNARASNGDGTSWVTAWNALNYIAWMQIAPGDTIYLSGGTTGQTYNETLVIGASGKLGAPITITASSEASHAGPVTINAQRVRSFCITIGAHNWVTVQKLTVQNSRDAANVSVRGANAGVVIQDIISHSGMGIGDGEDCRCFDIRNCVVAIPGSYAVIVQNCTATTPESTSSQTDAVWTSGNNGVLIQSNRLIVRNTNPTGHSDTIQSNLDISVTYRNNLLSHPNGGRNNHGFIVADVLPGGTIYFYNNIILMGSIRGSSVGVPSIAIIRQNVLSSANTGAVKMWNNTIINGLRGYNTYSTTGPLPTDDEFKNNIIYNLPGAISYVLDGGPVPSNIDYNDIYGSDDTPVAYIQGIGNVHWTAWQSRGYDNHGITSDPRFIDRFAQNFRLQPDSPALKAGTRLPLVTTDYAGAPRPAGAYAIGAYQTPARSD